MNFKACLVAAVALSPVPASAVTINVQGFGNDLGGARAARDAFIAGSLNTVTIIEDFESFTACTGSNQLDCDATQINSKIGNFFVIPGDSSGAGASVVAPSDQAVIRNESQFGRRNTTVDGENYLDSNDQKGIRLLTAGALPMFDRMAFFLMDIDDVGTLDFRITVRDLDNDTYASFTNGLGGSNNDIRLVTIDFGMNVSDTQIRLLNGSEKQPAEADGFAVDDFYVAAVPLPAAGWLMIAGLGGLAALRRRKRAA